MLYTVLMFLLYWCLLSFFTVGAFVGLMALADRAAIRAGAARYGLGSSAGAWENDVTDGGAVFMGGWVECIDNNNRESLNDYVTLHVSK